MIGELVLGRFRVERRLGSGGFGTVYRAWDSRLERDVAVKVIEVEREGGARVLREAQAAARLNHPGIVTLYEIGEENGRALLVSELVEGQTLRELSREGQLSDREVGEVGADLCEALDHAHARGVVHRDLKPQNVVLREGEPRAMLMDFGIASVKDAETLTATGGVVGTLAYMAPEQAEGQRAGPASDVFALALTLYECWSGRNPHLQATPAATARAIGSALPSLARWRTDLPTPLVEVLDAALDPDPERRPSLEELGGQIEACLDELDDDRAAPSAAGPSAVRRRRYRGGTLADVGLAAALAGLVAAAVVAAGPRGPAWCYLLVPAIAVLGLLRVRLAYLGATIGLAAWLGLAAGRPGAAVVLAVIALPPALLLPDSDRSLVLPVAAPALGAIGLALAFPLLAALAARWRERAVLAATGFAWLAVAEVTLRRELLFGPSVHPPRGWQGSAAGGLTDVLAPLIGDPKVAGALAGWALGAVLAGLAFTPLRAWGARWHGTASGHRRAGRLGAPAPVGGGGGRPPTLS